MPFEQISTLTDQQILDLHRLYQAEWWTKDRQLTDVRKMLQGPAIVVAVCDSSTKRLVAFARVITDGVYKALIFDVIATSEERGKGLGRLLIESILAHPRLRGVRHFELYCLPELVPFYEQWGFTDNLGDLHFMRLAR
jgi:GNAT superfamily N-acetyltransferase